MHDHDLYNLACHHLDRQNKRRMWWYVNMTGFLAYIGLFVVLVTTPLVFVAIFILFAWIGGVTLHNFVIEQAEAYDKNIEQEISRLRDASYIALRPAQPESAAFSAPPSELPPALPRALAENAFSPLDTLTPREMEVLALLAAGNSNIDIAERLVIAPNTVKRHVKHILSKLQVTNRVQAVNRARQLDLV